MLKCSVRILALLLTSSFLNGCMFSFTHTQGELNILPSTPTEKVERYIVVSLWDYPTVNGKKGDIVINSVVLTEESAVVANFPSQAYTVIWTPGLGTQHLAPEPGIIVFNKNHLPSWNVGGTDSHARMCCEKPLSKHVFRIELIGSEQALLEEKGKHAFDKWFLEEFLAEKNDLLQKMKKCDGLTDHEIMMVFDKLSLAARLLGIEDSR